MIKGKCRQFAMQNGMTVAGGVAYGVMHGYMLTLQEESKMYVLAASVRFADEAERQSMHDLLNSLDFKAQYGLAGHRVSNTKVSVVFLNNKQVFANMTAFFPVLCEQLRVRGGAGAQYCIYCGQPLSSAPAEAMLASGAVHPMHTACAAEYAAKKLEQQEETRRAGTLPGGIVGAALGGIVGAIPWAIVSYLGWFVGWLGFLIGFCAQKGYDLLHGTQTRAKAITVLVVSALAVVGAEYATCLFSLMMEIKGDPTMSQYGLSIPQISRVMMYALRTDSQFRVALIFDLVVGWVFAGLGVIPMVRNLFKETKGAHERPVSLGSLTY